MKKSFLFLVSSLMVLTSFAQDDSLKYLIEKEKKYLEEERMKLEKERRELEREKEMMEQEKMLIMEENAYIEDLEERVSRYNSESFFGNLKIESKGTIALTEDEKNIKSIDNGGFLMVSKSTFGNRRWLKISGGANGALKKEYKEGGDKLPFEPHGANWLAEVLPEILKDTHIAIEDRIERRYSKGGVKEVNHYIRYDLESVYIQKLFFSFFLKNYDLKSNELVAVAETAKHTISSDFELAELSVHTQEYFLKDQKAADAYFDMVESISSSFEKSRVLKQVQRNKEVLTYFDGWINTASTITSDFEKASVLKNMVNEYTLGEREAILLLKTAEGISSDFEKSNVLKEAIANMEPTDKVQHQMILLVQSIDSDFEARNVCEELVAQGFTSTANEVLFYESLEVISSSFEKRNVMQKAVDNMSDEGEVINAYFNALSDISSDFEMASVLREILKREDLKDEHFDGVLLSLEQISSSFEQANILEEFAKQVPHTQSWEDKFKVAAKKISSSYERDRVLAAWMKY